MTFSTQSAQPMMNQMPSQLMAISLGNRPGRLVTVTIFTLLANITLTIGLSLLAFHMQFEDWGYYRGYHRQHDGVWGGIAPMLIFGFASLAAAVTIAATSSDNPYSQRYFPNTSGVIGRAPRGLFEKPAFLSLVVAFATIGIALSASAGLSRLIFPAFIDRDMDIDYHDPIWPGIWVIIFFGIVFFAVSIIVISTTNRPKLISHRYYELLISQMQNPMMPGHPNNPSVQSQKKSDTSDVGAGQRSDASQEQSAPSENKESEDQS